LVLVLASPFVRPRFETAPVEWHLATVYPLVVARLGAEPLLRGTSRLDVTGLATERPGRPTSQSLFACWV